MVQNFLKSCIEASSRLPADCSCSDEGQEDVKAIQVSVLGALSVPGKLSGRDSGGINV